MIGPLLIVLCGTCSLVGVAAPIVSLLRHGKRGVLMACLGLPGAVMVFALAMLYIGIAEGTWKAVSVNAGLAAVVGLLGLAMIAFAMRSACRAKSRPGQCPTCTYELEGLRQCPECGRKLPH